MPHPARPAPQRHLPLEGTYNLRDTGGYPTHAGTDSFPGIPVSEVQAGGILGRLSIDLTLGF